MKYNILSYLIGDGIRNISKNKKSTLSALLIMVVTMLTIGVCFVIAENANAILTKMESNYPLEIYLDDSISTTEREKFENNIRSLEYVNPNIEYISKQQAYHNAVEKLGESSVGLVGYTESDHPFPQSYRITFNKLEKLQEAVSEIEQYDYVIGTSKDEQNNAEKLISFRRNVNITLIVIGCVLGLFSIVIIGNTIKLTVHARRKEISIMKYVGATNNFIRAPFVVEGVVIGLISSLISIILISGIYVWIRSAAIGKGLAAWLDGMGIASGFDILPLNQLFQSTFIIFLVMGIGIGVLGSVWSMKKYLKV